VVWPKVRRECIFVRFVALLVQGRSGEAIRAIDSMLESADREGSPGWRSCALSGRAWQRLMIDQQLAEHDVTEVLQDLVDAEIALAGGIEDSVIAENAHTGVGLGYHQLRLYELALPNYEAAYAVSAHDGRQAGNQAMWQCNLATLHLEWALELYRVHQVAGGEQHSLADTPPWRSRRLADRMLNNGAKTPTSLPGVLPPTAPTRQPQRRPSRGTQPPSTSGAKFKSVNDARGHAAGDGVLQAVAAVLAREIRDGDLVARLGGDEFGVLLPGASGELAHRVAQRMVDAIEKLEGCPVTVSIGVASGATSGVLSTWHAADMAMYVAKRAGGSRTHLHESQS
jgi:hypothetical protein